MLFRSWKNAEDFQGETGWTVRVNPSMNHSAAGSLLYAAFGDRLQKVSYYVDRKQYVVTVSAEKEQDREAAGAFFRQTGWSLCVNGRCLGGGSAAEASGSIGSGDAAKKSDLEFEPGDGATKPVEQNLAFSCIDQSFEGLPDQIEKKSLKQDGRGKYLEFSFVSPQVGLRYRKELQRIADQIGWRIRIADRVNQNALLQVIRSLCAEHGLTPAKNPSYIPDRRAVALKTAGETDLEKQKAVAEAFLERTGCACEFV